MFSANFSHRQVQAIGARSAASGFLFFVGEPSEEEHCHCCEVHEVAGDPHYESAGALILYRVPSEMPGAIEIEVVYDRLRQCDNRCHEGCWSDRQQKIDYSLRVI